MVRRFPALSHFLAGGGTIPVGPNLTEASGTCKGPDTIYRKEWQHLHLERLSEPLSWLKMAENVKETDKNGPSRRSSAAV